MMESGVITGDNIRKAFLDAGYEVSEEVCGRLSVYAAGILEKNKVINLTAVTDPENFIREHLVDSITATKLEPFRSAKTVCDVGTGAGFPGIVLAAVSPGKEITLIDSLAKRLNVIKELAEAAGIDNIRLIHARAEDAGRDPTLRESFDFVTARAVARLSVLSELCLPLVRKGGVFAAFKGASCAEEVREARRAANILGVQKIDIQDAGVTDKKHSFAVMKKTGKTPEKYPRKAGTPSRKPL